MGRKYKTTGGIDRYYPTINQQLTQHWSNHLERVRNMSADELFKMYGVARYEEKDIKDINAAIRKINRILNKYGVKFNE